MVYRELAAAEPYVSAVAAAGLQPVPAQARLGLTLDDCAGLLLTGGSDVNPALYGEAALPETEPPDDERDACEAALIDEALSGATPLLAICRGMQMLNAHLGGSLIQHLPGAARHVRRTPDKALPAHAIAIEPGTRLATIAGEPVWQVNSRHHQAVSRPGKGLAICARDAEDGTIEAVELPGAQYVLAVQWHPENQAPVDAAQRRVFESFRDAVMLL